MAPRLIAFTASLNVHMPAAVDAALVLTVSVAPDAEPHRQIVVATASGARGKPRGLEELLIEFMVRSRRMTWYRRNLDAPLAATGRHHEVERIVEISSD